MEKCRRSARQLVFVALLAIPLGLGAVRALADEGPDPLGPTLWHIRELRAGPKTDYGELDRRVAEAITKYPNPNDQGRIYLEALLVHALSGLTRADQAIGYAQKAENHLANSIDICQLYLSWGDALQFLKPGATGKELETARKAATVQYLKGMKVGFLTGVPRVLPAKPIMPPEANTFMEVIIGDPNSEWGKREQARLDAWNTTREKYFAAMKLWKFQEAIIERRDYCRDLIADLYCKRPHNTPELEKLATDILQDREGVNDLVERAKNRIKDRMANDAAKLPATEKQSE